MEQIHAGWLGDECFTITGVVLNIFSEIRIFGLPRLMLELAPAAKIGNSMFN